MTGLCMCAERAAVSWQPLEEHRPGAAGHQGQGPEPGCRAEAGEPANLSSDFAGPVQDPWQDRLWYMEATQVAEKEPQLCNMVPADRTFNSALQPLLRSPSRT